MQKKEDAFFLYLNPLRSDQIRSACSDHSRVLTIAFYVLIFFFFLHSQSTSWSKTQSQLPSACRRVWKWMIHCVSWISLSLYVYIFDSTTPLCDPKRLHDQSRCARFKVINLTKKNRRANIVFPPPHTHTLFSSYSCAAKRFFFLLFLPTWMKPSEWLKCRLHLYCASWKRAPLVSLPLNIFGVVFAKLGERHQSPVGKPMLIGWQLECKVEPWAPVPSPVQSGYSVHITSQPRGFLIRWLRFDLHGIFLYLIIFIFPPSFLSCNVLTFHLLDAQDFFNFIYFF